MNLSGDKHSNSIYFVCLNQSKESFTWVSRRSGCLPCWSWACAQTLPRSSTEIVSLRPRVRLLNLGSYQVLEKYSQHRFPSTSWNVCVRSSCEIGSGSVGQPWSFACSTYTAEIERIKGSTCFQENKYTSQTYSNFNITVPRIFYLN